MANASILAAFERFWSHVIAKIGTKADAIHSHTIADVNDLQTTLDTKASKSVATTSSDGLMSAADKVKLNSALQSYTETDPTVPSWAKAASKPSYTASEIAAGTFTGQVVANANGQTAAESVLRNSKLVTTDTNPTVNGEIYWTYE